MLSGSPFLEIALVFVRLIVRADEILTAFVVLQSAIQKQKELVASRKRSRTTPGRLRSYRLHDCVLFNKGPVD